MTPVPLAVSTMRYCALVIALRDGEPVRLRPWRVCYLGPDELDALAAAAGLELVERHADAHGAPFVEGELQAPHASVISR